MKSVQFFIKIVGISVASTSFFYGSSIALAQTTASSFTTGTRYNIMGQITGVIRPDPDGAGPRKYIAVRNTYNAQGLLEKIENGELSSWQADTVDPKNWGGFTVDSQQIFTYDKWGNVLTKKTQDAVNVYSLQQSSYDDLGRVECKAVRMNPAVYSALPNSACDLGAAGEFGDDRITKYTYNSKSQVTKIQKAYGTGLQQDYATYTYDGMQRESATDANGNYSVFRYDGFRRLSYWYFPSKTNTGQINLSDYEHYTYDEVGNRKSLRKRDGKIISYSYDNLNRTVVKDIPGGSSKDVYYGYNHLGLQTYARFGSSGGLGISNEYDGFGNLIKSTNNLTISRTLTNYYDLNNNRYRVDFPDGQYFSYGYDGLDRIKSLSQGSSNLLLSFTYNDKGFPEQRSFPSGAYTKYEYDGARRITDVDHEFSDVTSDIQNGYELNPANQLVTHEFTNDRYIYIEEQSATGSYQVNGLNQYTSANGKSLSYDANGNLTNDGESVYQYDDENRLTNVSGVKNASLSYDPLGRLNAVVSGSNTTYFLYDGDALVAEYDGGGSLTKRYLHEEGTDKAIVEYSGASVLNSAVTFLHANHQGSIVAGSSVTGAVAYINTYNEYGIPASTNVGRFAFTGQIQIPEIGLYHYKARIYNPKLGRFMQTDPIGYDDQINLYAYVNNDPVNLNDPTGEWGVAGAIYGAVAGGVGGYVSSGGDWKSALAGAATGGVVGLVNPLSAHMAGAMAGGALASMGGQAIGSLTSAAESKGIANISHKDIKISPATTIAGTIGSAFGAVGNLGVASMTARPIIGSTLETAGTATTAGATAGAILEGVVVGVAEKIAPHFVPDQEPATPRSCSHYDQQAQTKDC